MQDPLKKQLSRRQQEERLLTAGVDALKLPPVVPPAHRARETLSSEQWSARALRGTPHGHFDYKQVRRMHKGKFSSSVHFDDYTHLKPGTFDTQALQAEFPRGKGTTRPAIDTRRVLCES